MWTIILKENVLKDINILSNKVIGRKTNKHVKAVDSFQL